MKKSTAIFTAVILALLIGCQNNTSVKTDTLPTTTANHNSGISNTDPFPGFQFVNGNTKDIYGCVGHVHNEKGEFIGSGVLIAPSVVLTAGHVIEGETLRYFITHDKCYIIENTVIHPDYKVKDEIVNDLGVLILSEPCDEDPAQLIQSRAELVQREDLTTVGYSHNIKKISKPGTFWYYGTVEEEPQYMKFLPIKGHIWFGDSGGAVFEDGGHLAGIISSMTVVDNTLIEQSAIRLDRYLDWITDIMNHEQCSFK
jgi:S1-C subfamily serine protease